MKCLKHKVCTAAKDERYKLQCNLYDDNGKLKIIISGAGVPRYLSKFKTSNEMVEAYYRYLTTVEWRSQ